MKFVDEVFELSDNRDKNIYLLARRFLVRQHLLYEGEFEMIRIFSVLSVLFALAPGPVVADTLLLVPGYLGSADSWRGNNITYGLNQAGWVDAGHLSVGPRGTFVPRYKIQGKKRSYTLDLPTEARLVVQADLIARYVTLVQRRHPGERVILVGHSAGGVASRLAMVRYPMMKVYGLLTIASPHLGSGMADLGRSVSDSPLSWFAPFMGANTINRSRALYHDLGKEGPHNLLGWLNRAAHPKAHYISVIRTKDGNVVSGDSMTVGWRQNMNFVPALRGRARTFASIGSHALRPADSVLIARILTGL